MLALVRPLVRKLLSCPHSLNHDSRQSPGPSLTFDTSSFLCPAADAQAGTSAYLGADDVNARILRVKYIYVLCPACSLSPFFFSTHRLPHTHSHTRINNFHQNFHPPPPLPLP